MNSYRIILLLLIYPILGFTQKTLDSRPSEKEVMLEKLFIEATGEKILGNKDEAISKYQELLKKDPNNHMANYELATLYNEIGNFLEAYKFAENAVTLDKKSVLYTDFFSVLLEKKGEFEKAATLYSKLINEYPNNQKLYFNCAYHWTKADKTDNAFKVYSNLEKRIGVNPEIFLKKKQLYLVTGKQKKMIQELEKLIENNPRETFYALELASHYKSFGKNTEARKYYKKVLESDPLNPQANIEMADVFLQEGDTLRYITALGALFEDDKLSADVKLNALEPLVSSVLSSKKSKYEKDVLGLAVRLISSLPKNNNVYLPYAKLLLNRGDFSEAVSALEKLLDGNKDNNEYWNLLLESALLSSQGNVLIKKSEEYVELFPGQAQSQYYRGLALIRKGSVSSAIKYLKRAADMSLSDELLNARVSSALYFTYTIVGQTEKLNFLKQKVDKFYSDFHIFYNITSALLFQNTTLNDAEKLIKTWRKENATNIAVLSLEAMLSHKKSNNIDAKQYCEEAMNSGAMNDPFLLELYGDVLYSLNETQAALVHWKQALAEGAESESLKRKIQNKRPD